jgi:folate-dependent phosphoribosylglycinamide formyltransferase PurN
MTPLLSGAEKRPLQIVSFVSGSGENLKTLIALAKSRARVRVPLVISDQVSCPALEIARRAGLHVIARDFARVCGSWAAARHSPALRRAYLAKGRAFHDAILLEIEKFEGEHGIRFDLAVLSYRKWIRGRLLARFKDRMINQHPGDLSLLNHAPSKRRVLAGLRPVEKALELGHARTRTTTFLVNRGHDSGEILCQGPWIYFDGDPQMPDFARFHEYRQKLGSDRPSLIRTLEMLADGDLALSTERHADGCRILYCKGAKLPYCGVQLSEPSNLDVRLPSF